MFIKLPKLNNRKIETVSSLQFISRLENHVISHYSPNMCVGLIEIFHFFIDSSLYDWYFKLDTTTKSDFTSFKSSFLKHCTDQEYLYNELAFLPKEAFLTKLKTIKSSEFSKLVDSQPLTTYFSEKLQVLNNVYPNILPEDLINITLTLINWQLSQK